MDWFLTLQRALPQHLLSRAAGYLAATTNPVIAQPFIRWFARQYRVDLSEAAVCDIKQFESFNEFFTRRLRVGARPLQGDDSTLVCPADGTLAGCGALTDGHLLQAKGARYALSELVGDASYAAQFAGGQFATIYLAPHNYHRVHLPVSAHIARIRPLPGRLYSVNARTEAALPTLFVGNKRTVIELDSHYGPIAVVMVGALIVGAIKMLVAAGEHHTRGDELGCFELGSTVILCLTDRFQLNLALDRGRVVRVGEALAIARA